MRLAGTIFFTVAVCAWSTVMYAWVDQRQRVARQRSITAQAALRRRIDRELDTIRARMDEELAELRGWMDALHTWLEETTEIEPEDEPDDEPDDGALAWQPDPAPATQPIVMPAPAGPATEPADQVLIAHWAEDIPHPVDSDDRKAQHEAWVTETLARYEYTGRNR